jgi:hypothetical protein
MDEQREVEIVNEIDGEPQAVIVRDSARKTATFHCIVPVVTHTEHGPVIAPTAFAFSLN